MLEVQSKWAAAITNISRIHKQGGDYIKAAAEAAGELYAYGHSNVMFKPTKAAEYRFRPTAEEAMSYFAGGGAVKDGYKEDGGFAINGGNGWASCVYKNHQVQLKAGVGIAMGAYDFTCATTGSVSTVEYTFGYTRCKDSKVRIFLHHSSVPFAAAPATKPAASKEGKLAAVTGEEVLEVQSKWAAAIANISSIHKKGGDYIKAAAEAAGELYAYGHSNVMFKPTKAAEYRFRPTAEEAMSYFVGGSVVKGGYKEDGGFAINGGKGWASCVYKNHQVQLKGGVGIAMGTYDFTCATTGSVSTVEYTVALSNWKGCLRLQLIGLSGRITRPGTHTSDGLASWRPIPLLASHAATDRWDSGGRPLKRIRRGLVLFAGSGGPLAFHGIGPLRMLSFLWPKLASNRLILISVPPGEALLLGPSRLRWALKSTSKPFPLTMMAQ